MLLQKIPKNFEDFSDENGFQFCFYCELCNDGVTTKKVNAKSSAKSCRRGFMTDILRALKLNRASDIAGVSEDIASSG